MKTTKKLLTFFLAILFINCSNNDGESGGENQNNNGLFKFIDTNSETSYAIKNDGTLWVWGANNFGQYGNGVTGFNSSRLPQQVGTDNNWESVSSGNGYVFAIKTNGTLWSWGWGSGGALGNGSNTTRNIPLQIGTSTDWKSVYSGNGCTYAIKDNNTLWSTGISPNLGDGSSTSRNTFQQVSGNWTKGHGGYFCNYALNQSGVLYGCGDTSLGLGISGPATILNSLTAIGSINDWTKITSSDGCGWAVRSNGNVYTFGKYNFGGGQVTNATPTIYAAINNVKEISASTYGQYVLFIKNDGTLWAVGKNNFGQLGDGTTTDRNTPVQIGSDTNWENVVAGYDNSMARKTNGEVYVWGLNGETGNLGLGDTANRLTPTRF
jgi:alpha-tubulin suppressor-like RCC1 family protein